MSAAGKTAPTAVKEGATLRDMSGEIVKNVIFILTMLAVLVLIVLPVGSLLIGSMRGETGVSFDNFIEAVSSRLTRQSLINSMILGGWTSLFSVLIGVPLAWAVGRANVPGKPMIYATATLSYLSPPFLTAIAFVGLLAPNSPDWVLAFMALMCGLILEGFKDVVSQELEKSER